MCFSEIKFVGYLNAFTWNPRSHLKIEVLQKSGLTKIWCHHEKTISNIKRHCMAPYIA